VVDTQTSISDPIEEAEKWRDLAYRLALDAGTWPDDNPDTADLDADIRQLLLECAAAAETRARKCEAVNGG